MQISSKVLSHQKASSSFQDFPKQHHTNIPRQVSGGPIWSWSDFLGFRLYDLSLNPAPPTTGQRAIIQNSRIKRHTFGFRVTYTHTTRCCSACIQQLRSRTPFFRGYLLGFRVMKITLGVTFRQVRGFGRGQYRQRFRV